MSGGPLTGILGGLIGGEQAQMGNGILGNLNGYMTNNAGALLGFGAGMLSGDAGAAAQGAMQGMQQDQRTRLIQQKQAEEERAKVARMQAAQKLGIDPVLAEANPELVGAVAARKYAPKEYGIEETYLRNLQQTDPERFKQIMDSKVGGGSGTFGLNPVYGTDAEGNPVILQMNNRGGAAPVPLPPGVKLSKEPIKLDAGTHFVLLDPITRQQVGVIPKDLAGAERAKEIGKAEGSAIAGAPAQKDAADVALGLIDQIKTHPGMSSSVGWQAAFPTMAGSKAAGFENLVEQAKSGAFLTAIQQMRGMGALSEKEGAAATAAINRMNVATSETDFMKAVSDYEAIVRNAKAKAEQRMGGQAPTQATQQRRRYNPQTGEFE